MDNILYSSLSEQKKNELINALTNNLVLLRSKSNISQEDLASFIGISRQTYGSIERKTRKMSWNTYLSLLLYFDYNQNTHRMIRDIGIFPNEVVNAFNFGKLNDLDISALFGVKTLNIVDLLDSQAVRTLKTVALVEYARCVKTSLENVISNVDTLDLKM